MDLIIPIKSLPTVIPTAIHVHRQVFTRVMCRRAVNKILGMTINRSDHLTVPCHILESHSQQKQENLTRGTYEVV